jgi:hypothetical protein
MATGSVVWSAPIEVSFSDGRPRFPTLEPCSAGLYRLTLADGLKYIGKAKDLNCRLGNYRNPCAGVDVENILYLMLVEAGTRGDKVTVETCLTDNRHALERQEIKAAIDAPEKILNKGGLGYPKYVEFKIKYYEKMLNAAKDEQKSLSKLVAQGS